MKLSTFLRITIPILLGIEIVSATSVQALDESNILAHTTEKSDVMANILKSSYVPINVGLPGRREGGGAR